MKNYHLKIRSKFIVNVRNGIKKHEYRLATPERKQIKVGDTLVLISNQDAKDFVKVTVKKVTIFNNWQEALRDTWKSDFSDICLTYDEVLKE